jgi:hypothetical protein
MTREMPVRRGVRLVRKTQTKKVGGEICAGGEPSMYKRTRTVTA